MPGYSANTLTPGAPGDLDALRSGAVDALTFTSASTVDNFCDLIGELPVPTPTIVSIGPITTDAAKARGLTVDAEADPHTIDGLVASILGALS